jgi:molecular chaperone GrpE
VSEKPNQENIEEALDDDQVTLDSDNTEASEQNGNEENKASQNAAESEQVAKLTEELTEAKEQALRAVAEAQNVRRRAEQDVEKAHKFALEKFVGSLLPVVDNLERALDAASAEGADPSVLNEGVELTLKTFVDALQGHKVEQVAPEGEPFDPQLHQAISAVESPEAEPNTVLNVVQKGYTLNGRLVRPAMVVVSKASS